MYNHFKKFDQRACMIKKKILPFHSCSLKRNTKQCKNILQNNSESELTSLYMSLQKQIPFHKLIIQPMKYSANTTIVFVPFTTTIIRNMFALQPYHIIKETCVFGKIGACLVLLQYMLMPKVYDHYPSDLGGRINISHDLNGDLFLYFSK